MPELLETPYCDECGSWHPTTTPHAGQWMPTPTWDYVAGFFDGEGTAGWWPNRRHGGEVWSVSFSNTHRIALEKIQEFLGAGAIRERKGVNKPVYALVITRLEDLRRILPELIQRCIVKRADLEALAKFIASKETRSEFAKRRPRGEGGRF